MDLEEMEKLKSSSETQNHDLLKENSNLTTQIEGQTITLDQNQEEIDNLIETLSDKNSKLKLQQQKIETFEKNMNTLKDGTEETFSKLLLEEIKENSKLTLKLKIKQSPWIRIKKKLII